MKPVELEIADGVATVTLNRPDQRNAINEEIEILTDYGPFKKTQGDDHD